MLVKSVKAVAQEIVLNLASHDREDSRHLHPKAGSISQAAGVTLQSRSLPEAAMKHGPCHQH